MRFATGTTATPEESSNAGRLDMAVRFNGQVYLFELKVVKLEPEGRALQQIKDRGYAEKYRASGLPIHLIGVELSRERRSGVGFDGGLEFQQQVDIKPALTFLARPAVGETQTPDDVILALAQVLADADLADAFQGVEVETRDPVFTHEAADEIRDHLAV